MRWDNPSHVEPELVQARAAVARYKKAVAKGGDSESSWADVLTAVDEVLDRCDALNERTIPGQAP
jgi:hypothetical protein